PWSGPALGGTVVTIGGAGLAQEALQCRFGAQAAVWASLHGGVGALCVAPPAPGVTGWVSVELLSHSEVLQSGSSFYVYPRIFVSAVVPSSGPVEGGTRLAVVGTSFRESATLRCRVTESGAVAVARLVSSSQVECAAPASSGAGVRHVEVSLNAQQYSSSGVEYTYRV
ncbi:MAG: IPT/TIG domain-containing protein, partial [Pseudomonadota bacterium]|nr:IPT/TIG domain-containing protein [Pseudomonadota bacterium]